MLWEGFELGFGGMKDWSEGIFRVIGKSSKGSGFGFGVGGFWRERG